MNSSMLIFPFKSEPEIEGRYKRLDDLSTIQRTSFFVALQIAKLLSITIWLGALLNNISFHEMDNLNTSIFILFLVGNLIALHPVFGWTIPMLLFVLCFTLPAMHLERFEPILLIPIVAVPLSLGCLTDRFTFPKTV